MNMIEAFRKAVTLYGKVFDFPVIVQYASGRLDSIPSAQLKDIHYDGEAYEVLYAMRTLDFLKETPSAAPAKSSYATAPGGTPTMGESWSDTLSDADIQSYIEAFHIEEAV
jgi:hypothetical protein